MTEAGNEAAGSAGEHSVALSVIVPVYNAAAYLPLLLRSLLAQTQRDLEVILIDDGSTDDSLAIIEAFALDDARVRLLRQANAGVSSARNQGLDAARGRWIAFADADDWVAPDTYTSWIAQARAGDVDLLIGASFRFKSDTEARPPAREGELAASARIIDGKTWIQDAVRDRNWQHFVHLQLIRREFLLRQPLRFVEGIVHEDVLWTAALMLAAQRIVGHGRPLYGYRVTPGSLSSTATPAIVRHRALSYFKIIEGLLALAGTPALDGATATALRQQAGREAKHLYTLIAVESCAGARAALAAEFIARQYPRLIGEHGYGNRVRRNWRALKAGLVLGRIARREA